MTLSTTRTIASIMFIPGLAVVWRLIIWLFTLTLLVHTRRDECVGKEGYYTLLGIKEDGSREVLSIINQPTEGALLWEDEMWELKRRGVESVTLFVSDALNGYRRYR